MAVLLTDTAIRDTLAALPGWQLEEGGKALLKNFTFKNFKAAFAFMRRVAEEAEALKHHPEWTNVYNRIAVRLTTHDAGGLTVLDIKLAEAMEAALTPAG